VLRPANEASTINDRQVDILRSLNQAAQVAILDLVQLAFLSPTEGVLGKIADGRQHTADQVSVGLI
jgi:hypothetical protein